MKRLCHSRSILFSSNFRNGVYLMVVFPAVYWLLMIIFKNHRYFLSISSNVEFKRLIYVPAEDVAVVSLACTDYPTLIGALRLDREMAILAYLREKYGITNKAGSPEDEKSNPKDFDPGQEHNSNNNHLDNHHSDNDSDHHSNGQNNNDSDHHSNGQHNNDDDKNQSENNAKSDITNKSGIKGVNISDIDLNKIDFENFTDFEGLQGINPPYKIYELFCNSTTNDIDCKEAVPYLKFIYDHYYRLPAKKIIFTHAHEVSWHVCGHLSQKIREVIESEAFKKLDYGPINGKAWHNRLPWRDESCYDYLFKYVYQNTSMWHFYEDITTPMSFNCCGTFFVDFRNIYLRPREEYLYIIQRLRNYSIEKNAEGEKASYYCSRLMEYTWHLLLSNRKDVSSESARCYSLYES
ncbi:hypothetical protein TRFO_37953 [Tritrichomonas foetus]|uniref:Uncharacterized protein n=1 Tax=Tritrichomonas foetus TaxID=1144522 RepID=A0A1J4JCE5_9EUKA|nr:hypothetical protein TRFO_37953 [Tritrichomonas foetus]|eukprot:OHS95927.1 hypothetical protein TRFO_37953 [Tritrichomonas foetus]